MSVRINTFGTIFRPTRGGDVFTFVMEVEGMDFRASLEHLARKAGVDLSMYDTKGSPRDCPAQKTSVAG